MQTSFYDIILIHAGKYGIIYGWFGIGRSYSVYSVRKNWKTLKEQLSNRQEFAGFKAIRLKYSPLLLQTNDYLRVYILYIHRRKLAFLLFGFNNVENSSFQWKIFSTHFH